MPFEFLNSPIMFSLGRRSSPESFLIYMFLGSNTHTLGHLMCGHSPQLLKLRNPTLGSLHLLAWFCCRTDVFKKKCNWNHNLRTQVIEVYWIPSLPLLSLFWGDKEVETPQCSQQECSGSQVQTERGGPFVWPAPFCQLVLSIKRERIQVTFMNGHYVAPVVQITLTTALE